MENASKALIIVTGILIGIMLLSFMLYMFKRFNATARETDIRLSQRNIEEFNAKFENYDTFGSHSLDDVISATYQRGNLRTDLETVSAKYKDLFAPGSNSSGSSINLIESKEYYNKLLIAASRSLNTISDVVSAVNDAIDINDRNSNHYRYNEVEVKNSVEIIIDLGKYKDELNFANINGAKCQYFVIEPNPRVVARYVYGVKPPKSLAMTANNTRNKERNVSSLNFENDKTKADFNAVKVYNMLNELRETKIVQDSLKKYTVYQYYFMGEIFYNDDTDLIETVKFTLLRDENF